MTMNADCILYDLYLVSQHVNKGTANPTHYNDTNVFLLVLYQLAHKLEFLAGQSLQRHPNPDLEDLLYF
ncbi:piwi-like protein Siwi [Aphis craccivora]|uniref:Piwi-like protein Siwi n=1 Tax=Aphis craccivora TaxID=307492 RepID=A0A6G0Y9X8_APHCR|nr:piwi-like protein Siwi [Aphis craccivora]